MRRASWQTWCVLAACLLLVGCGRPLRTGYPPDPLLLNKPAVEGKAAKSDRRQAATSEQTLPPLPPITLTAVPPANSMVQVSMTSEKPTH